MPKPASVQAWAGSSLADVLRLMGTSKLKAPDEEELGDWLQQTLAAERAAFAKRLQSLLQAQLASHHESLFAEIAMQLEQGAADSDVMDSAMDSDAETVAVKVPTDGKLSVKASDVGKEDSREVRPFRTYRSGLLAEAAATNVSEAPGTPRHSRRLTHVFEIVCSVLIFASLATAAAEVQYHGGQVALALDHPEGRGANDTVHGTFNALTVFFSASLLLEIVLRAWHESSEGWRACCNAWLLFDCLVMVFGAADCYERLGSRLTVGMTPTVVRVARVARMLRIVKVLRTKALFQPLFLLVNSIMASWHTLVWFVLILYTVVTCVGLLTNQLLYSHMTNPTIPESNRQEVYEYFGTYTRILVSMFEITLGNWAPPCRVLMSNVDPSWGLLVVAYRTIFCFSLVNVTVACFITETSAMASNNQVLMMRKRCRDRKLSQTLRELFREIDASGDGLMSLEELRAACKDKVMKAVLEVIDLDVQDIEELFELMDNGEGQVRQEDFVKEVLLLRGEAKSSRQVAMMKLLKDMRGQLQELMAESRAWGKGLGLVNLKSQWSKDLSIRSSA